MKKLIYISTVIVACTVVFACQPPKEGGYDAPSKSNAGGRIEEIKPQKTDSSVEKSISNKSAQDTINSK